MTRLHRAPKSGLIAFQGEYKEKGQAKRAVVCIGPNTTKGGYDLVRRGKALRISTRRAYLCGRPISSATVLTTA